MISNIVHLITNAPTDHRAHPISCPVLGTRGSSPWVPLAASLLDSAQSRRWRRTLGDGDNG